MTNNAPNIRVRSLRRSSHTLPWEAEARSLPPSIARIWVGAFLAALILYTLTANRGVQSQDSGWQQYRIVTGQLEHARGLALTHPLHYYLGRAAIKLPIIEPALATTLISSLAGSIAVANLAMAVHVLTRRLPAALIASAAFMLAHTVWQHATHTESYALAAALLATEWLCLAAYSRSRRPVFLLLLALGNGLGLANHPLALLATPIDALVMIVALRRRWLTLQGAVGAAGLWVLGTLPYTLLVVSSVATTGDAVDTLRSALFGRYAGDVLNLQLSGRGLLQAAGYVLYNFPGLTVPLAIFGICATWARTSEDKWLVQALVAELLIYAAFVCRYSIADQYTFFFPVYLLLALAAGLGLSRVMALPTNARRSGLIILAALTAVWTPIVYLGTCSILRSRGLLADLTKNKPYRDGYRVFFVPWGLGVDHAATLNRAVRELAGNDGLVLVEDHMQVFGLRYAQKVGELPATVTIHVVDATRTEDTVLRRRRIVAEHLRAGKPVLLVPRNRDRPEVDIADAQWERNGDIYRLAAFE